MKAGKICFWLLGFLLVLACSSPAFAAQKVLLAVYVDNSDYVSARDAFRQGLESELKKTGLTVEFIELNTKGDKAAFISRVRELGPGVDLIFTTGTPNAMAIKESGVSTPVLFSAVANAVGARLVESNERPNTNFTGCHCDVPVTSQLKALLAALPKVKRIGVLFNPNDPAPVTQAKAWEAEIARQPGLEFIPFHIPPDAASDADLAKATQAMIGKVDVIVTTADAKVAPYPNGVISVGTENRIPVYATLSQMVYKGAIVSLGFNFPEGAGRVNVPQAVLILNGANVRTIPVQTFPEFKLIINNKKAKEMGITIPLNALKTASDVIQ